MIDPIFWLGLSFLIVAISLTSVLVVLLPAVQELVKAAHSLEKLCDTLRREFPPTLEAIRLTGLEVSELTDDLNQGVKSAADVVKQVDEGLSKAKKQMGTVKNSTQSLVVGVKTAWRTWQHPPQRSKPSKNLYFSQGETMNVPTRHYSAKPRKTRQTED